MKKILLALAVAALPFMTLAQPAQRTVKTTVADALAQMPAESPSTYNTLMLDLAKTGAEGIGMITDMLHAPGTGINAPAEYALSGVCSYVAENGMEKERAEVVKGLAAALNKDVDPQTKAFIITMMQICGKDDAVDALSKYMMTALEGDIVSPAAIRAVTSIGTPHAQEVIANSIKAADGTVANKAALAKAAGDAKVAGVEDLLIGWLKSGDADVRKAALYALSATGTEKSIKPLGQEAKKTGYTLEATGATGAYLTLLNRLATEQGLAQAGKAAQSLLKSAKKSDVKSAALETILAVEGKGGMSYVLDAVGSGDKVYRNAALNYASAFADNSVYARIAGKLNGSTTDQQVDILTWLGNQRATNVAGSVISKIGSTDPQVRTAAITAAGKIGGDACLKAICNVLATGSQADVNTAKTAISSYKGYITDDVMGVLAAGNDAGKVAAMQVLAARKATSASEAVFGYCGSSNPQIKTAALTALKGVVTAPDVQRLFTMMEAAPASDVPFYQQAAISALSTEYAKQQTRTITNKMDNTSADKKPLYYIILANTGDPAALKIIADSYDSSTGAAQEKAIDALLAWQGMGASDKLYEIAQGPTAYASKALDGYINNAAASKFNNVRKYQLYRNAFDIAKNDAQKNTLLKLMASTGTLQALMLAGQYIDNAATQQTAARTVMAIALADKGYYGDMVTSLLKKASSVLTGGDAEYERSAIAKHLNEMQQGVGYYSMFNGKDLAGWKGLVGNPVSRSKMTEKQLAEAQQKADARMRDTWSAKDGMICFSGKAGQDDNLCTEKQYGNFEMYVDWRIQAGGDAGIYLRGTPQVQIWDPAMTNVGAQVGSGGLYNNAVNPSKPLKVADNPVGQWNSFYIKMVDDRVTVYLNGELVVDNVMLENYWNRSLPIFIKEQIELQAHGTPVEYRDLYINELPDTKRFELSAEEKAEGYVVLFDGTSMSQWQGNTHDYVTEEGNMVIYPSKAFGGNLYTKKEYKDFSFRFEFQLTPGANNGVGIRAPLEGDAAYLGMEIQILDDRDPIYANIEQYQAHGSVYGVIPSKRDVLKPLGEWNSEEIRIKGSHITVTLNGVVIVDGDILKASKNGAETLDHQQHPGLLREKGYIGFLGHGSVVKFRNIRILEL